MGWEVSGEGEERAERVRRMARWSSELRDLMRRGMWAKIEGGWWRDERQRVVVRDDDEQGRIGGDGLFVAGSLKHLLRETGDRELIIAPEINEQREQVDERDGMDVDIDLGLVAEVLMEIRSEVALRPSSPEAAPDPARAHTQARRQEERARERRSRTHRLAEDRPRRGERTERVRSPRRQRHARTEH